jgi:hypothetical protein
VNSVITVTDKNASLASVLNYHKPNATTPTNDGVFAITDPGYHAVNYHGFEQSNINFV